MRGDDTRRNRRDSDASTDAPDFYFFYTDADTLDAELAEWYTYSEEAEFSLNVNAFRQLFFDQKYGIEKKWFELSSEEKRAHIMLLLEHTESSDKQRRDNVCRAILYLVQGAFKECECKDDYKRNVIENVAILYECDAFSTFVDLLLFEINNVSDSFTFDQKYAPCISDNMDIRVILSVLYTMLEVIRNYEIEVDANRLMRQPHLANLYQHIRLQLKNELNRPLAKTNELFSVYLFDLVNKFCNKNLIVLPIKKILLMLWKVILFTLGGVEDAFRMKNELRAAFNLPLITENPSRVINQMSPSNPPPNPIEIVNELQFSNPNVSYNKRKKNSLIKQAKGIEADEPSQSTATSPSLSSTLSSLSTDSSSSSSSSDNNSSADNSGRHNPTPGDVSTPPPVVTDATKSMFHSYFDETISDNSTGVVSADQVLPVTDESVPNIANQSDETSERVKNNPADEDVTVDDDFDEDKKTLDDASSDIIVEKVESSSSGDDENDGEDGEEKDDDVDEEEDEDEEEEEEDKYESTVTSPPPESDAQSDADLASTIAPSTSSSSSSVSTLAASTASSSISSSTTATEATTASSSASSAISNATYVKLLLSVDEPTRSTLPWKPKVKSNDIEQFLDQERKKFLGYGDLANDLDTLIGLPYPIHESIHILKQHLYVSLGDEQIKLEEKHNKYPLSMQQQQQQQQQKRQATNGRQHEKNPVENLYASLLNSLPQYLICLLKLLLTAVPQTKPKGESIQIMSDLFPEDFEVVSRYFTIRLGIDSNRHKEIIIKAISAIIFLMLKHFKVNHVYQFEFMCQHLLFANCVPLILKFFNFNILSFIQARNNYVHLDFPNCVIGEQIEPDDDEENGDNTVFRWRNVFSCINLLRILNKIVKNKRSRVMMLVIFKSAQTFKKVLHVKQAMLQYYALKLIKMQTRNMGRNWRKSNMSTISAIYQKIRHRINDDWVFGNELEAQAWDFQSEESVLRGKIDSFNQRMYKTNDASSATVNINAATTANASGPGSSSTASTNGLAMNGAGVLAGYEFKSTCNQSMFSAMSSLEEEASSTLEDRADDVRVPENFVENYESWLAEEVFSNKIDWDALLLATSSSSATTPNVSILF